MRKTFASSAFVLFLSGCALPVPLQIASWALDGLSVLTTQKSVADHAISLVAEKDCAIWRGLTEGEVCRDIDDNTTTAIADASETSKPDDFSTETIAFNEFQYADAAGIDELPTYRRCRIYKSCYGLFSWSVCLLDRQQPGIQNWMLLSPLKL